MNSIALELCIIDFFHDAGKVVMQNLTANLLELIKSRQIIKVLY